MPPLQSGKDTMFKDCLSLCTSELIIWVFIFFIKHCISAYQIFLQIFLLCFHSDRTITQSLFPFFQKRYFPS
ncbi:unnamed protein product [Cuscuta campestris]|uniref:Uncharacterized protein n=1 Tax=Cuscuta campestris TaxID=132261 RepID=A0A484KP18_9ASTE|nr:unnamed protein product [Cuscuta campestris]